MVAVDWLRDNQYSKPSHVAAPAINQIGSVKA
jgi:hypothetical protein